MIIIDIYKPFENHYMLHSILYCHWHIEKYLRIYWNENKKTNNFVYDSLYSNKSSNKYILYVASATKRDVNERNSQ